MTLFEKNGDRIDRLKKGFAKDKGAETIEMWQLK